MLSEKVSQNQDSSPMNDECQWTVSREPHSFFVLCLGLQCRAFWLKQPSHSLPREDVYDSGWLHLAVVESSKSNLTWRQKHISEPRMSGCPNSGYSDQLCLAMKMVVIPSMDFAPMGFLPVLKQLNSATLLKHNHNAIIRNVILSRFSVGLCARFSSTLVEVPPACLLSPRC